MATIRVTVRGDDAARSMDVTAALLRAQVAQATRDSASLLQTMVRVKASTGYHRPGQGHIPGTGPGPNVATGQYLRTIAVDHGLTGGAFGGAVPESTVFSPAAQATRLENGFVGTDSLGRSYRQPAYPHWGPAVDEAEPLIEQLYAAAIDRLGL